MLKHQNTPPLFHLLLSLLLMALTSFLFSSDAGHHHHHKSKKKHKHLPLPPPPPPPASPLSISWDHLRALLNCKSNSGSTQVHDPSSSSASAAAATGKHMKLGFRFGPSICALGDVVHGSIRVVHRSDSDQSNSSGGDSGPHYRSSAAGETEFMSRRRRQPAAAAAAAKGGSQLMRLSGCYECRAVDAEPVSRRYPRPRTLCACPQCGEVFNKTDSLELHQTIHHAVSELGPEDSGRHIVEIIFKSSWQKNHRTICKIDRILKVHNTPRTIARFEDYRAAVKSIATAATSRRNPRCAADGNELLRFHSASISCHLGAAGSTTLCFASMGGAGAAVACGVCDVIRHGFRQPCYPLGVRTTASSGQAHEDFVGGGGGERAMLVCRVIAGRVCYAADGDEGGDVGGYDSVAAEGANLEELFVANPRAILPCFVVIYSVHD